MSVSCACVCLVHRSLDMCGCGSITNAGVKSLAQVCQRLEYLDISSTKVTHQRYTMITMCFQNVIY